MKRTFIIQPPPHPARQRAIEAVQSAPDGYAVTVGEPTRNLEQNARFHALCADASKQATWQGRKLSAEAWKVLFVSGHSVAAGKGADMVPGLEGEFVNIRESTAQMSKSRLSSLIEYVEAWGVDNGIKWSAS